MPRTGLVGWWDMAASADSQHIADLAGGNPLQLGATAGAEGSDPTLNGSTAAFSGNATYMLTGTLASLSMAADFTAIIVGKFTGITGDCLFGLSASANDNNWIGLFNNPGGNSVYIQVNKSAVTSSGGVASPGSSWLALQLQSSGGTLTLKRLDNGTNQSVANPGPVGTPRIGVGCLPRQTVAAIDSLTVISVCAWSRALNAAESQRARDVLKARAASHGLTVL
jgi:hypothetical protein